MARNLLDKQAANADKAGNVVQELDVHAPQEGN